MKQLHQTFTLSFNALFQDPSLTRRPKFCIAGMRLGFGKNSRNFYVFSNNYIFIQYQHNQQSHISYDVIHSIPPKASTCMTLVVPVTTPVDIVHVITMVGIRLWLFDITSAMLGLRMLQLLCRLPIKLHS